MHTRVQPGFIRGAVLSLPSATAPEAVRFGMLPPDAFIVSPHVKLEHRGEVSDGFSEAVEAGLQIVPELILKKLGKTGLRVILAPSCAEGIPGAFGKGLVHFYDFMLGFRQRRKALEQDTFFGIDAVYHVSSNSVVMAEYRRMKGLKDGKLQSLRSALPHWMIRGSVVHEVFHAVDARLDEFIQPRSRRLKDRLIRLYKNEKFKISAGKPFREALGKDIEALKKRETPPGFDAAFLKYLLTPSEAFAHAAEAHFVKSDTSEEIAGILKHVTAYLVQDVLPRLMVEERYY